LTPLDQIQQQLALSDVDWDQIVALVADYEGLTIFSASSRAAGVVELNLIETAEPRPPRHPTIVVEKRGNTVGASAT
jgi:hypothetical protein